MCIETFCICNSKRGIKSIPFYTYLYLLIYYLVTISKNLIKKILEIIKGNLKKF